MFCLKNRTSLVIIAVLSLLNIFAWQLVYDLSEPRYLKAVFFNVGQGDAIFIETPFGQQILIDGGPSLTVLEKLGKEMPFYDRTLDLVILTHPEKDHMAGLLEVLKRYRIKNILWTGIVRDTAEWQEWVSLIQKERALIRIAEAGDKIILQKENPFIFIDILNPEEGLEGKELENSNDTSIVFSLIVGYRSFLFTGDIDSSIEKTLSQDQINTDVLKVAHHGSGYSTSEEFLESVSPDTAVILVGENSYGHPSQELLARLNKLSIEILRTDKDGDIKIISDGKNIKTIIYGRN